VALGTELQRSADIEQRTFHAASVIT